LKKENDIMMNKNERMNKLANAGVDTKKYFNIDLPQELKPGARIFVMINEDGQPVIVANNKPDAIADQIITNGYVRNTKLHRRFVMAQMFQMLNYVSWSGEEEGYHAYLKNMYSYEYTLKMMLEEVKVLSCLEISDKESFDERSHFFTKEVIVEVLCDYVEKLKNYIDKLPTKKCKGVPYKKIKNHNIFVDDLNKRIYRPLLSKITYIKFARSYTQLHSFLKDFMNDMIKLPYNTPKSKAWIDAFKGEGAYYTLKNLVMFHNCRIEVTSRHDIGNGTDSMSYLKAALDAYKGEGWRMFALMKKVIKDNGINTRTHIAEVCNNK